MNRRDLLFLRSTRKERVFELPCEQLYMQFVDTRRPNASTLAASQDDQLGEPEASFDVGSAHDLFVNLRAAIAGADVLRVVDPHWLTDPELKARVDELVVEVRAAGGRVEIVDSPRQTAETKMSAPRS